MPPGLLPPVQVPVPAAHRHWAVDRGRGPLPYGACARSLPAGLILMGICPQHVSVNLPEDVFAKSNHLTFKQGKGGASVEFDFMNLDVPFL